jgi:hypothetical protein
MAQPLMSHKRAKALTLSLFLLGLAIVSFLNRWWPGIMLVFGIPLSLQQYLMGRLYDMCVSLLVFVGAFITIQFDISFELLLPVLFTLGAIYVFFREFLEDRTPLEDEREEDLNLQIEEEIEEKKHVDKSDQLK